MGDLRKAYSLLLLFLLFAVQACTNSESNQEKAVFKNKPEIQIIKPHKPVQIKLKRNGSGSYSWELKGDDAAKVLEADEKLRGSLEKE
jgi:predicted secreted protein